MVSRNLQPLRHPTKTQALSAQLFDLAHELGPGERLPTAQQLCTSLQVSMVTLNRALIELESRNVLDCRRGVGIFVSPHLGLRNLGLLFDCNIFGSGSSSFAGLLMEAVSARASVDDGEVSVHFALPSKRRALPVQSDLALAIREKRLDGVMFSGDYNPEAARWIEDQGVPLVTLSSFPLSRYQVSIDYEELVRVGVESLHARGCKRIGLWLGAWFSLEKSQDFKTIPQIEAFQTALQQHDLPFRSEWVWGLDAAPQQAPLIGEVQQARGSRAAHAWFGAGGVGHDLDGLIITNDIMTRAALPVLRRLGVQPGKSLHIVSHGNRGSDLLLDERADVTLIEVDPVEVADALFDLLEPLLENQTPPQSVILIRPRLAAQSLCDVSC